MLNRIVVMMGVMIATLVLPHDVLATNFPTKFKLENGDLIWARPKKGTIYYDYRFNISLPDSAKGTMPRERDWTNLLSAIEKSRPKEGLKDKKYAFFFDTLGVYPGHVAIVSRQGTQVDIIEAANEEEGVTRTPLKEWLSSWSEDPVFWIGRLSGFSPEEIGKIVAVASSQVSKRYDMKNLDLSDATAFYCSKLIWYAVAEAIGKALDGQPNPKRWLPYSPKQIMKSDMVRVVYNNPADY